MRWSRGVWRGRQGVGPREAELGPTQAGEWPSNGWFFLSGVAGCLNEFARHALYWLTIEDFLASAAQSWCTQAVTAATVAPSALCVISGTAAHCRMSIGPDDSDAETHKLKSRSASN